MGNQGTMPDQHVFQIPQGETSNLGEVFAQFMEVLQDNIEALVKTQEAVNQNSGAIIKSFETNPRQLAKQMVNLARGGFFGGFLK
jgi:hypothetical protein